MFQIKICGITTPEDALAAVECGADAVGLNFYPPSPRSVDFARAREIAAVIPAGVLTVGVFVNASAEEIRRFVESVPLGAVQLHGEEPPKLLAELRPLRVIRAFRLRDGDIAAVLEYLSQCEGLGALPQMVLVDAYDSKQYGGTGKAVDWSNLAGQRRRLSTALILAGGLHDGNVAEAIRQVMPDAVDTASGVESRPGRKDRKRLEGFVTAARTALEANPV